MQLVMCAVRDAKTDAYNPPIFVISLGVALRSFDDEVNRQHENNMMYFHPEDFSLWQLGTFNDGEGTFEIITPRLLVQADQVKKGMLQGVAKV